MLHMIKENFIKSIGRLFRLLLLVLFFIFVLAALLYFVTGKIYFNFVLLFSVLFAMAISISFLEHKDFFRVGLAFRARDIVCGMIAFAGTAVFYAIFIVMESFINGKNLFPQYLDRITGNFSRSFLNVLLIPLTEEMLHRGYILGNCFQSLKCWQRSLLSAFIFSLTHWVYMPGTDMYYFLLVNVVSTFVLGFF